MGVSPSLKTCLDSNGGVRVFAVLMAVKRVSEWRTVALDKDSSFWVSAETEEALEVRAGNDWTEDVNICSEEPRLTDEIGEVSWGEGEVVCDVILVELTEVYDCALRAASCFRINLSSSGDGGH